MTRERSTTFGARSIWCLRPESRPAAQTWRFGVGTSVRTAAPAVQDGSVTESSGNDMAALRERKAVSAKQQQSALAHTCPSR